MSVVMELNSSILEEMSFVNILSTYEFGIHAFAKTSMPLWRKGIEVACSDARVDNIVLAAREGSEGSDAQECVLRGLSCIKSRNRSALKVFWL